MTSAKPTREQADLAEVLEMVLDKGIVINADVAITVGDTELLGIELRAAIASFETAAEYGLSFPSGTDMRRVQQASGREPLHHRETDQLDEPEAVDLGIDASSGGAEIERAGGTPAQDRPRPEPPTGSGHGTDRDLGDDGTGTDTSEARKANDETDTPIESEETGTDSETAEDTDTEGA